MTAALAPGEAYDVQLPLDGRWLDIPVIDGPTTEDEVSAWAGSLVEGAAQDRGAAPLEPYRRMVLEQMYVAHLELARNLVDDTRFVLLTSCLVPGPDLMPVVTVNLSAVVVPHGLSRDDAIELWLLPEEQRFTAPDLDELDSPAGSCLRIRQLVVGTPVGDGTHELAEAGTSLLYLWPTQDENVYLLLDAYFTSESEAQAFESDLDAVAAGLTLLAAAA